MIIRGSFCEMQYSSSRQRWVESRDSFEAARRLARLRCRLAPPLLSWNAAVVGVIFQPAIGKVLPEKIAAKLNPLRRNVAENNVLVDEDAIRDGEIGV